MLAGAVHDLVHFASHSQKRLAVIATALKELVLLLETEKQREREGRSESQCMKIGG